MDVKGQLLELEEQFWKGDAEFYRRQLSDDALMVFAEPVGRLTRDRIVDTIAAGPRWAEVNFEKVRVAQLTDAVVIVTYKASARREDQASRYLALASSVYVNEDGAWKLAFHQQTPE